MDSPHAPPPPVLSTRLVAVDVETTGLDEEDRIVSFGAAMLDAGEVSRSLAAGRSEFTFAIKYLICNPQRKSHPIARRLHGFGSAMLAEQQHFGEIAEEISRVIDDADLVIAHNAEFDLGFLNRELAQAGRAPISKPIFCTMLEWRRREMPGRATLDNVAAHFGYSRSGRTHGALEDAVLALAIYLGYCGIAAPLSWDLAGRTPDNLRT